MTRKQRKKRKKAYKQHMKDVAAKKLLDEAERLATKMLTGRDIRKTTWTTTNIKSTVTETKC